MVQVVPYFWPPERQPSGRTVPFSNPKTTNGLRENAQTMDDHLSSWCHDERSARATCFQAGLRRKGSRSRVWRDGHTFLASGGRRARRQLQDQVAGRERSGFA